MLTKEEVKSAFKRACDNGYVSEYSSMEEVDDCLFEILEMAVDDAYDLTDDEVEYARNVIQDCLK